jgi:hypothetical protein
MGLGVGGNVTLFSAVRAQALIGIGIGIVSSRDITGFEGSDDDNGDDGDGVCVCVDAVGLLLLMLLLHCFC